MDQSYDSTSTRVCNVTWQPFRRNLRAQKIPRDGIPMKSHKNTCRIMSEVYNVLYESTVQRLTYTALISLSSFGISEIHIRLDFI